jgi:hypothetical protein
MQIRSADAAGRYLDPNLTLCGLPIGDLRPFKRGPKLLEHHGVHRVLRLPGTSIANST